MVERAPYSSQPPVFIRCMNIIKHPKLFTYDVMCVFFKEICYFPKCLHVLASAGLLELAHVR